MISDPNPSTICPEVLVVFARGSGQNQDRDSGQHSVYDNIDDELAGIYHDAGVVGTEKQTASFINEFHKQVPTGVKYVSLHNNTQPTAQHYNQYGYAAVSVPNSFKQKPNHRKDVANRYYESVKDGSEELAWYIEDQLTSCSSMRVVVGGYSQGAEVAIDGINLLKPAFRDHIAYMAMYGDPYYYPYISKLSLTKGWWARGNAELTHGLLGARMPYLPEGINYAGSWCQKDDNICDAGGLDFKAPLDYLLSKFNDNQHSNAYQGEDGWIAKSMPEIVHAVKVQTPDIDATTSVYVNKNDKLWDLDLAVVIDTSSSMSDSMRVIRNNVDDVTSDLLASYWNSRVGIVTYDGTPTPDPNHLYSQVVQPFTNSIFDVGSSIGNLRAEEPYYGLTDGTPYMLGEQSAQLDGIMTAINGLNWEQGAQKKIIVITNNPAAAQDPSPNHWTADQVKQAAFNLDPAGLNLANVSCDDMWNCDYSIDEAFQQLNGDGTGETSDVNLSYGTIDDLTMLLEDTSIQPVAKLTGEATWYVNIPMQLNANESYSPEGPLTEYDWDCDGDSQTDAVTSSPTNDCTYTEPGDYVAVIRVVNENNQSTQAVWPVHISAGSPPAMSAAPEAPNATLTYSDNSMNLSWNNDYDSSVYLRVSDDQDNLIGYAPAEAKSVVLAGIGSDVPELRVSVCTDDGSCSEPTVLSLDHEKLEAMVVGDDADTFVVPTTAPISVTPTPTQEAPNNTPGSNDQQSTSTDAQKTDASPSLLPATTVDFLTSAPNSVLGDTAPTSVAQQFTHHAITATSTSKPYSKAMGSKWKPLVLFGGGLLLIAVLFRFFWLQKATR